MCDVRGLINTRVNAFQNVKYARESLRLCRRLLSLSEICRVSGLEWILLISFGILHLVRSRGRHGRR